jgi:FkbM family methyltransferase
MISYSQNYEDVILWRALKHVKKGCYIDIGAWDPVVDSVSMFFYTQGWRGIHVEPNPSYAKRLRKARPDEAVIEAAIGESTKPTTLFIIEDTGLTTSSKTFRDQHKQKGFTSETIKVPTRTLASIFDDAGNADIHWLKIDAEGMEEDVIRSWGDNQARPWVVVVESTLPSTNIEVSYGLSELAERGYTEVYFDALNKFFVHKLHSELVPSFKHGPNIFDDFIRADHNVIRDQAEILNKDLIDRTKELVDTRAELLERTELLKKSNNDLNARTKELVNTRAELLERTELVKKSNNDLNAKTKDLVNTRAELLERTKLLEKANVDLAARTKNQVGARAELLERTKLLEKANEDLTARTKDLVDTRAELFECTKLLEKSNDDLAARTKGYAQLEKELRNQTEKLKQEEHEVNRLINELIEEQKAHKELQMTLWKTILQMKAAEKTINYVAFASNPFLYFVFRKLVKEIFHKINLLSRKL